MKKTKKIIWNIIFVIALIVFLYSGYQIAIQVHQSYQASQDKKEINKIVQIEDEIKEPEKFNVNFDHLLKINPDIVGFIYIPNTNIVYPIVQGATNDTYLRTSIHHQSNEAGAIFLDSKSNRNFSDLHSFIYGHNMKNGSMFADIQKYRNKDFFHSHQVGYLYTPEKQYRLDFYGIESIDLKNQNHAVATYGTDGITNPQAMQKYYETTKNNSVYSTAATMEEKSFIISLSTCSYENGSSTPNGVDGRYVLHAIATPLE